MLMNVVHVCNAIVGQCPVCVLVQQPSSGATIPKIYKSLANFSCA